jgi:hypothetical protein
MTDLIMVGNSSVSLLGQLRELNSSHGGKRWHVPNENMKLLLLAGVTAYAGYGEAVLCDIEASCKLRTKGMALDALVTNERLECLHLYWVKDDRKHV